MNNRLHYMLNQKALYFPFVGMLESTEPISFFDLNSIPSAVLKAKECLDGGAEGEYSVLDNSHFADHRIDLTKIELAPDCNAYFFFEIACEKDTDSFFYIHTSLNIRIWHNEQFFSITRSRTGVAFTIQLKKGSNRICLEYPKAKRGYVLSFWINSFENESKNDYLSVLDGTANRLHP